MADTTQRVTLVTCTEGEIIAVFTEWDRRYRANPDAFMSEAQRLLFQQPGGYGLACAAYFIELLREQP